MTYLFKTCYSIGKSIIQVNDKSKDDNPEGPPNLVDLAIKYKLNPVVVVEDSLAGIWPIHNSLEKEGIGMIFGFRVSFVRNGNDKTPQSNSGSHKNIIFANNETGYKKLIKISTQANVDFLYKQPRLDYNYLHEVWTDDLSICVPFYDSFLFQNLFRIDKAIPDFRGLKPTYLLENHNLIYDPILRKSVQKYAAESNCPIEEVNTVLYERRDDFLAWKTRKLMVKSHGKRNDITRPNLPHCSSNTFCLV